MRFGVVVGRFQTDKLHKGHEDLLQEAYRFNDHVLVFIGISSISGTKRNPLDYTIRHQMVSSYLGSKIAVQGYSIEPIKDVEDDADWSIALDDKILNHCKFGDEVTLYGAEDSFLNCYNGQFKDNKKRVDTVFGIHSTDIRDRIVAQAPPDDTNFRRGVIYGIGNTRNTVSCTVDIACIAKRPGEKGLKDAVVLVGRKPREKRWRFPGGFVDYTDRSMKAAAQREFLEETGLTIEGPLHHVGSSLVDDWRFRNSPDKAVMTTLFACSHSFGQPKAGDDLAEVQWIPLESGKEHMTNGHSALFAMLKLWLKDYHSVL